MELKRLMVTLLCGCWMQWEEFSQHLLNQFITHCIRVSLNYTLKIMKAAGDLFLHFSR